MISSRFLISAALGLFSLALGCLVFVRNPSHRPNRSFAVYMLVVSVWLAAPGFIVEFIPHHATALLLYRLVQISLPLHPYFLIRFVHDFAGVFDKPGPRRIRLVILGFIAVFLPFYPTSLVIKDFSSVANGTDFLFIKQAGPLYLANIGLFLGLFVIAMATTFGALASSSGAKRNQMKFLSLAIGAGILSVAFYLVSFVAPKFPPLYFATHLIMLFGYAYTMFRYQLFEFGFLMRRIAIYAGVYLTLLSVPFLLFFPLREYISLSDNLVWMRLTGLTIGYAVLFSLAPILTAYLRHLSEQKRWDYLHEQLNFLRHSSESLADEAGLSLNETANRILAVIRELYWVRLRTPLTFVFAVLRNQADETAIAVYPEARVDENVLREFLADVADSESGRLEQYARDNGIEIWCPCVHNGKLYGAILLGPKQEGIFWPEESAMLQVAASYVATAVRKSELITRTQELHDLDRLKHDLISNITHEFKLPLANVDTAVEILSEESKAGRLTDAVMKDFLDMIRNSSAQLGFYIQNLLSVAKIERAQVNLDLEDVDVNELLKETSGLVAAEAQRKNLTLSFHSGEALRISADREKLKQVLANLLSNAVKFTDQGSIVLEAHRENGHARISVTDTGRGIDEKYIGSVFEKFFRAPDPQNKRTKGTGLGLAIAKGWVEAHGGRIRVESKGPGSGTRFTVDLPII